MTGILIVSLLGAVAFVVLVATLLQRRKATLVTDFRSMFLTGIMMLPLAAKNLGFLGAGLLLMAVGWRNKPLWGKHTRWADFPPELKRLKLATLGALGAFALSVVVLLV